VHFIPQLSESLDAATSYWTCYPRRAIRVDERLALMPIDRTKRKRVTMSARQCSPNGMPRCAGHDHGSANVIQQEDSERNPERNRVYAVQPYPIVDGAREKKSSDQEGRGEMQNGRQGVRLEQA
jgi:hypothetical protein